MTKPEDSTQPDDPSRGPSFLKGYRRLVPGEVTEEGDFFRNGMSGDEWAPVEVGHEVRDSDRVMFVRPESRPIANSVLHRALARFSLFCCEEWYKLENMVTANQTAAFCHCCGVEGELDDQGLFSLVEHLSYEGVITSKEKDELDLADVSDDEDDYLTTYEDIRVRKDGERVLPPLPMMYEHDPECAAYSLGRSIMAFDHVFGEYVRHSLPEDIHKVAAMTGPEDGWL